MHKYKHSLHNFVVLQSGGAIQRNSAVPQSWLLIQKKQILKNTFASENWLYRIKEPTSKSLILLSFCGGKKVRYYAVLNSPVAVGLHTMGIMSKIYTISCTLLGAFFAQWEFMWIQRILEKSSKVAQSVVWEGVEIKITTDKWSSEIYLSFGIKICRIPTL